MLDDKAFDAFTYPDQIIIEGSAFLYVNGRFSHQRSTTLNAFFRQCDEFHCVLWFLTSAAAKAAEQFSRVGTCIINPTREEYEVWCRHYLVFAPTLMKKWGRRDSCCVENMRAVYLAMDDYMRANTLRSQDGVNGLLELCHYYESN